MVLLFLHILVTRLAFTSTGYMVQLWDMEAVCMLLEAGLSGFAVRRTQASAALDLSALVSHGLYEGRVFCE